MYPRTRDSYEALVAEFGDDPSIVNISRPSAEKPELPSSESENELLRAQLKHIRSTIDNLRHSSANSLGFQIGLNSTVEGSFVIGGVVLLLAAIVQGAIF